MVNVKLLGIYSPLDPPPNRQVTPEVTPAVTTRQHLALGDLDLTLS